MMTRAQRMRAIVDQANAHIEGHTLIPARIVAVSLTQGGAIADVSIQFDDGKIYQGFVAAAFLSVLTLTEAATRIYLVSRQNVLGDAAQRGLWIYDDAQDVVDLMGEAQEPEEEPAPAQDPEPKPRLQ